MPQIPTVDDALSLIVDRLRQGWFPYSAHGYDVHLPKIWQEYVREQEGLSRDDTLRIAQFDHEISPPFYAAAWELCRKGVLRPGVKAFNEQVTTDGQGGAGYSLTPSGQRWLADMDEVLIVPVEPTRQARMLEPFAARFGPGFAQRAQEAVRCYQATAYLACCSMSGAAAESVLLATAIEKQGDENAVLRAYKSANGRRRAENMVIGTVAEPLAGRFKSFTDLLNYWRDDASHGAATTISEIEAYDALSRLLRFTHLVDDHWDDLTS